MIVRALLQKMGLVGRDETGSRTDVLSAAERRRITDTEREKEREVRRLQWELEDLRARRAQP